MFGPFFMSLSSTSVPPQRAESPMSHADKASGSNPGSRLCLWPGLSEGIMIYLLIICIFSTTAHHPSKPPVAGHRRDLVLFSCRHFSAASS